MLTTIPMKSARGLDTPVTEIMHHGLVVLRPTATLTDAARAMRDNDVHGVLIEDLDGTRLGWVTSRGVLHNHARDWTISSSAADAITEVAATVASSATIASAIDVFVGTGASHIVVTADGSTPIGLVAESDLVAFLAR
jgi:predicted transcriptional regulator